ncbi:hypothetical protein [Eleftheria terrae]|uniref:hypothetical protein n=1 Tax=Eleftheria terrae TaxID=1597781 RepID=UPI00263AAA12|nr:hypothetical protein [Eleftheria terrae]WKB52806.1 hypothetical protein N7L95_24035 [Eleftheria terrae]
MSRIERIKALTELLSQSSARWSPSRRGWMLTTASSALLAGCGGGGDSSGGASESALSAAAAVPAAADPLDTIVFSDFKRQWAPARRQELQKLIDTLDRLGPIDVDSGLDKLNAAIAEAERTGRPIRLASGKRTRIAGNDQKWELKEVGTPERPVRIYCGNVDGQHILEGGGWLFANNSHVHIYNCRFVQTTVQGVYSRLVVKFNTFECNKDRLQTAVRMLPLSWDSLHNELDMQWNHIGKAQYCLYAHDLRNSRFSYNWCDEIVASTVHFNGGFDNHFDHNYIFGGKTGIINAVRGVINPSAAAAESRARHQSHFGTRIRYNRIRNVAEESISYDAYPTDTERHPVIDHLLVGRIGATKRGIVDGPEQPKLLIWSRYEFTDRHPGISNPVVNIIPQPTGDPKHPSRSLYRGYCIMWLEGRLQGKYAQIYDCTSVGDTRVVGFALRSPGFEENRLRKRTEAGVRPNELTQEDLNEAVPDGDWVTVCAIAADFEISRNVIDVDRITDHTVAGIVLWGAGVGFSINNNDIRPAGPVRDGRDGIAVCHVAGFNPKDMVERLQGGEERRTRTAKGAYETCLAPVTHGSIVGNRLNGLPLLVDCRSYTDWTVEGEGRPHLYYTFPLKVHGNRGLESVPITVPMWCNKWRIDLPGAVPAFHPGSDYFFDNTTT